MTRIPSRATFRWFGVQLHSWSVRDWSNWSRRSKLELSRVTNRRQLRPLASEEWLSEYVKKARNPGRLWKEASEPLLMMREQNYEFVVSDCRASISVSVAMCHSPYLPFSLGVNVADITLNICRTPGVSMLFRDWRVRRVPVQRNGCRRSGKEARLCYFASCIQPSLPADVEFAVGWR